MKQQQRLLYQIRTWIRGWELKYVLLLNYSKLVAGTSSEINTNRKEYTFNTLIFWSSLVSLFAIFYNSIEYFLKGRYLGWITYPSVPIFIFLILLILLFLSKKVNSLISRYIFVLIVFLLASYTSLQWGSNVPQGLLLFGFSIILAGILINSVASGIVIVFTGISLFLIYFIHSSGIYLPVSSWKNTETQFIDLVVYLGMFSLIAIVSWLSNSELEHLLKETKMYSKQLEKQKGLLEVRVQERTLELQHAYENLQHLEKEKFVQVNKLATLGKFSSGLIHDIIDPLTYVSTSLELALWKAPKKALKIRENIQTAMLGTQQISNLIDCVRTSIRGEIHTEKYSLKDTINKTVTLLKYTARFHKVIIKVSSFEDATLFGNPSHLYQCLTNLLSNAIESYPNPSLQTPTRIVHLHILEKSQKIVITVMDHGKGISTKESEHIFDLFYTTKPSKDGTGIGLSMCKEIVEKNLKGHITWTSTPNRKTVFTLTFPIVQQHS